MEGKDGWGTGRAQGMVRQALQQRVTDLEELLKSKDQEIKVRPGATRCDKKMHPMSQRRLTTTCLDFGHDLFGLVALVASCVESSNQHTYTKHMQVANQKHVADADLLQDLQGALSKANGRVDCGLCKLPLLPLPSVQPMQIYVTLEVC
jgi:hypothetical protein